MKILDKLNEREWSGVEIVLALLVTFMSGIVIGLIASPKGTRYFGCYNSNNENCCDKCGCEELED